MRKKSKIIRDKLKDKILNGIWTLFETKEEKEDERIIKDRKIRDIRTLFEQQEEDYYEPKRVSKFWNNGDKNRNLSPDEYLNKIEPYLMNITIGLQNSDAWKIQLTIAINFISSKHGEEERVMHSNSCNIKFTPYSDANDVVENLFESLRSKYQDNLETLMKESNFIFDSVQLMY